MTKGRVIVGNGQATNPYDADHVVIEIGVRGGNVVTIRAANIRTGMTTLIGDLSREVWFKSGAEARALSDDTFGGCDTARNAALVLHKIFIGHTIDECLAMSESEVRAVMTTGLEQDHGCVATVVKAVRNALIDVQVTALAEAVVNVKRLQATSS
jgi:hypothetical protein